MPAFCPPPAKLTGEPVQTLSYTDFRLNLDRRVRADRIPLQGTIEVTHRCPLSCVHCFNNRPLWDREARRGELSAEEHCRLLDEIAKEGCLWLLFTGGEIFARPDFLKIYTHAKKQGLLITLFTNGTLITPRIADHLAEWRPFSIEVTLYGRSRETYERITGVPGSHAHCLRGVRLLLDRGLPLKLKTVVLTENQHELRDMKRFAEEELGVGFRFDAMVNPRMDFSRGPLDVRLDPQSVVELDLQDPDRMAEWRRFDERFRGPILPPHRADELYHCSAGVQAFAVDPAGRLRICPMLPEGGWDLGSGSFREGWTRALRKERERKITRETRCTACHIKAMCGMCPANGLLENRDAEAPVGFLCQVAHLRARALGLTQDPAQARGGISSEKGRRSET